MITFALISRDYRNSEVLIWNLGIPIWFSREPFFWAEDSQLLSNSSLKSKEMATIEDVLSARPVAPESLLGAIQNQFDLLFASSCSKLSRDAQSLIHAPSPVQVKAPEPRRPQDQQGPSPSPLAATPLHSIKKYRCGEPFSNAGMRPKMPLSFRPFMKVPA